MFFCICVSFLLGVVFVILLVGFLGVSGLYRVSSIGGFVFFSCFLLNVVDMVYVFYVV